MELTVHLRTLTPLWTGGVDGTMDRIHETGILGSLRWWYEAIVRGLGGEACDPTKHEHELTGERLRQYERARREGKDWWTALDEAGICDACKVFGTTGWRRRFRLEVRPVAGEIDLTEGMFPSGRVHPDRRRPYRVGGWLLRGGYFGTLELHFTGDERVLLCEILPTLLFIEKWGALGAKTSIGYGVIEITKIQIDRQTYRRAQNDWRAQLRGLVSQNCQGSRVGRRWWFQEVSPPSSYQGILPALTNMFFGKVRFKVKNADWWKVFREIRWLQAGQIRKEEAHWTGEGRKPEGPFIISNPFPVSRIEHWVRCHDVFPLAPIVRTRLRYGDFSIGVSNGSKGESDWCKFVFGTVRGNEPICGYCGTRVRRDRHNQNRWWCSKGHVSLASHQILYGKRIQSKVRVSWAYHIGDHEWEFRLWGWLPEHTQHEAHQQRREAFLHTLKQSIEAPSQLLASSQLQDHSGCWVEKGEESNGFLQTLLEGCRE